MKKNVKNIVKGIVLSLCSLVAGYFAISLPFHLFDELSSSSMHVLFVCEIIVYLIFGIIFLFQKDRKAQKRKKEKQKSLQRQQKIKQMQEEWINLAA